MPARIISVINRFPGTEGTLIAAALCRWFRREHHPVCPFVGAGANPPSAYELEVLARSAELVERLAPYGDEAGLVRIQGAWEYIVLTCGEGFLVPHGPRFELLSSGGREAQVLDAGMGTTLSKRWFNVAEIFPEIPAAVVALPEWHFQTAPRAGVFSLPHLRNFADFRLLRGAEWITSPPAGAFQFLIVPASSDESFDRAWMIEYGLDDWMRRQREQGCRVLRVGNAMFEGEPVEEGALQDFRTLSLILGRRMPPPEPEESVLNALASWLERMAGAERLRELCAGS